MDIQQLSMNMADTAVKEQAGMAVLGMAMNSTKDQAAALGKLMESGASVLPSITDPALGQRVDIQA